jgi:hypothetical protein
MRSRNLKPGFFKNEELASCGATAMLCFAGLWCLADREGRLEDRPARIKVEILPYFECDVNGILDALASKGFIIRYECDGLRCIEIPTFKDHQNPHHREGLSKIPASTANGPRLALGLSGPGPGISGSSRADSPFLIPDSSNSNNGPSPGLSKAVAAAGTASPKKTGLEKELERRGLPPAQATALAGKLDPDLLREILAYFDAGQEAGQWEIPLRVLRSMLKEPEARWCFVRTEAGWQRPPGWKPVSRQKTDDERRTAVAEQRKQAEQDRKQAVASPGLVKSLEKKR